MCTHLQDGRPRAVDDEAGRLGSVRVRVRGRGRFRGRFRVRGRVRMMKQAALGPLEVDCPLSCSAAASARPSSTWSGLHRVRARVKLRVCCSPAVKFIR